ncbi:MAG: 16S rRNA (cytidine(1402)-2'-O)-methyltransferase [Clostridia bacterium]|nr:16S rRNA (cytidine(1402)-2'-O)-methyltransferase [Clostridia bacterium]
MSGKLYVVGTPIGNLGDLSPRAVEVLSSVDFIAAEDTRVTAKLLNHFDIHKPLESYFEHNKEQKTMFIIKRLKNGEKCAIVSDAGMPAISDPGEDLVRACREEGIAVESVPGPSAVITALAASGMPGGRFCFEGFLSAEKKERRARLDSLKKEERTMIFYEAPHKLRATLADMLSAFGDREVALCRELTKLHEEVMRKTLTEAVAFYEGNEPRGEYVLIVAGAEPSEQRVYTVDEAANIAKTLMEDGMSASAAAKEAAAVCGIKKGDIYKSLTEM